MGVIIRGPDALDAARRVDVVALDKTGTVTTGRLEVVAVEVAGGLDAGGPDTEPAEPHANGFDAEPHANGFDADRLLGYAAALEDRSEHPVAAAIARAAAAKAGYVAGAPPGASQMEVVDFTNLPGLGVQGRLAVMRGAGATEEVTLTVGRPELFESIPEELANRSADHLAAGHTLTYVGSDSTAWGFIALADRLKPSSAEAVAHWRHAGMQTVLLSGDNRAAAEQVGQAVGVDRTLAELTPAAKVAEIERLQASGRRVAMIGDGVNDAPALATADVGVAIGTGADVAAEASDLTLVGGDLRGAVDALNLARRTLGTIRGNLFWAFAYNSAAIPLAAAGLLQPEIAAMAMALSSLFVLGNSLRLNSFAGLPRGR